MRERQKMICNICPRACNIDRENRRGFCGMGELPVVSKAFLHMWEEPCISGTRGSGTVFFSGCNLKCIFCQNHEISHGGRGKEITVSELAGIFRSLQEKGAHNINLVTPSHFTPAIREALCMVRRNTAENPGHPEHPENPEYPEHPGPPLEIPVVYNTNAYDGIEGLRQLEGLIDVYLPDLKYISSELSLEYSGAGDYFEKASRAILEMRRQAGPPVINNEGILQKGMIIRHLVLPGHANETLKVLDWISENLPGDMYVSLMSQYIPCYKACSHPILGRRITRYEYEKVINRFVKLGLKGYVQERESASEQFIPDFNDVQF